MTTTTSGTTNTPSTTEPTGPVDPIGADLTRTLRALKLGGLRDTLPERLALARQRKMGHAAFLELLLADEVTRRDSRSAMLRAKTAGLDPSQTHDQIDRRLRQTPPASDGRRISPPPGHQLPVPAQQRRRCHQKHPPPIPG
jgi:hypothetical protein